MKTCPSLLHQHRSSMDPPIAPEVMWEGGVHILPAWVDLWKFSGLRKTATILGSAKIQEQSRISAWLNVWACKIPGEESQWLRKKHLSVCPHMHISQETGVRLKVEEWGCEGKWGEGCANLKNSDVDAHDECTQFVYDVWKATVIEWGTLVLSKNSCYYSLYSILKTNKTSHILLTYSVHLNQKQYPPFGGTSGFIFTVLWRVQSIWRWD